MAGRNDSSKMLRAPIGVNSRVAETLAGGRVTAGSRRITGSGRGAATGAVVRLC